MDEQWWSEYAKREEAKRHIAFAADAKHDVRLRSCECKKCFYLTSDIAGQAFTGYDCIACGKGAMHHNTNTPSYCPDCAIKLNVCCRCGQNLT